MGINIDADLLFVIVNALGGDDVGQLVADDAYEFINKPIIKRANSYLLLQEWQMDVNNHLPLEDIIGLRNFYFKNQFDIITSFHGIISQIWGDLFVAYWYNEDLDINKLIVELDDGINKAKKSTEYNGIPLKVNKIKTYIDYGSFYLVKNGSPDRFNYTPLGLFYNSCLSVIKEIWKEKNNRWFFGEFIKTKINIGKLKPIFKIGTNTVNTFY